MEAKKCFHPFASILLPSRLVVVSSILPFESEELLPAGWPLRDLAVRSFQVTSISGNPRTRRLPWFYFGFGFGQFIELALPGGGLLWFVPGLVKFEDVPNGGTAFRGRHRGRRRGKHLRVREQQGFGLGKGAAGSLNGPEPVRCVGRKFGLPGVLLPEKCQCLAQQRFGFIEPAFFQPATPPLRAGEWEGRGSACRFRGSKRRSWLGEFSP